MRSYDSRIYLSQPLSEYDERNRPVLLGYAGQAAWTIHKRMRKITLSNNKIYDGNLILVNAAYSLQSTRENELVSANTDYPDILLCRDAASALQMVLEKISAARDIVPVSGYRSQWEQTQIYNDSLKRKRSGIYKEICCTAGP